MKYKFVFEDIHIFLLNIICDLRNHDSNVFIVIYFIVMIVITILFIIIVVVIII